MNHLAASLLARLKALVRFPTATAAAAAPAPVAHGHGLDPRDPIIPLCALAWHFGPLPPAQVQRLLPGLPPDDPLVRLFTDPRPRA